MYSSVAVNAAKSNARRLREQDGGTLDLHRQSLRQHGLLDDRHSIASQPPSTGGSGALSAPVGVSSGNEDAIRAESRRRKEEAKARELEELRKAQEERYSLWNWIRGK